MIIKNKCIIETVDIFRPLVKIISDYDSYVFPSPPEILVDEKYSEMEHFLVLKSPEEFYWDLFSGKYKSGINMNISSPEHIIMTPRIDFAEFVERCVNLNELFSVYFLKQFKMNVLNNPKESNMKYIGNLTTFDFKDESLYEFYINFYSREDTVLIRYDVPEDVKILEDALGETVDFNIDTGLFDLEPSDTEKELVKKLYNNLNQKLGY